MQKILLISGKAQNGKSESAKQIKQKLESKGYKVCIIPFAKYLKQIVMEHWKWDGKTKSDEIRSILQNLGTDIIREKMNKPQFHTSRVCDEIEITQNMYDFFIIDDWRFIAEYHYVGAYFPNQVMTIRVHRLNYESPLTKEQQLHKTEIQLDNFNFDYRICSESGAEYLEREVNNFIKYYLLKDKTYLNEYDETIKDLYTEDEVKITKILDTTDAKHLTKFIGQNGIIISFIKKSGKYRYKVAFETELKDGCRFETHYFRRNELELVKAYDESEADNEMEQTNTKTNN